MAYASDAPFIIHFMIQDIGGQRKEEISLEVWFAFYPLCVADSSPVTKSHFLLLLLLFHPPV